MAEKQARGMVALKPEVHEQLKTAAAEQGVSAGRLVETMLARIDNDRVKELVPEQSQLITDAEKAAEKLVKAVAAAVEQAGCAREDAREEYERRLESLASENRSLRIKADTSENSAAAAHAAARAAAAEKKAVEAKLEAVEFERGRYMELVEERDLLRAERDALRNERTAANEKIHSLEIELAVAKEKAAWLEQMASEGKGERKKG